MSRSRYSLLTPRTVRRVATHFDAGDPAAADPTDRVSSRPAFAILCCPVISFVGPFTHARSRHNFFGTDTPPEELARQLSDELRVTPQTPPTFLFLTDEDTVVPAENSVAFYLALRRAVVPAKLSMVVTAAASGLAIHSPTPGHASSPAGCKATAG